MKESKMMWNNLAAQVHEDNVKKGFWPGGISNRNVGELLALVHSEITEAHDAVLSNSNDDKLSDLPGFDVEIADAMIRLLDASAAYEVDLGGAFAVAYLPAYSSMTEDLMDAHMWLSRALEAHRKGKVEEFRHSVVGAFQTLEAILLKWGETKPLDVINRKLEYNRSRPFMHGKKY